MSVLDHLVPVDPRREDQLRRRLAVQAARRLGAALARWTRLLGRGRHSAGYRKRLVPVRELMRAVSSQPSAVRNRFLSGGDFRTWLAGVEDALSMARAARETRRFRPSERSGRGNMSGGRASRTPASWVRLMECAADAGELARLAPTGKLPSDFPDRAMDLAMMTLDRRAIEFPLIAIPFLPVAHAGRFRTLYCKDPGAGLPVTAPVTCAPDRLTVRPRRDKRFEQGVQRALALMRAAWPEAATLVKRQTQLVVPIIEPGTVSYSSARRPGVSYINIHSRPSVRLAEDLLHEASHMRLHDIESLFPLTRDGGEGADEGPRFYSPWRREWRPLRGLIHGAFTFTVGAQFFERMLCASKRRRAAVRLAGSRRLWLARRLLEEVEDVRVALRSLREAERAGLLLAAGRGLLATISRERRSLAVRARRRRQWLSRTPGGRAELVRLEAHIRRLSEKPLRWSWARGRAQGRIASAVMLP